jgi:D-arabinose 5-phosphate isomerase GutQ
METPELPALRSAQRVIGMAITELTTRLDNLNENFQLAVDTILKCDGRLIVMGVGKSGHIARKLAATFASTGTPASEARAVAALLG